MIISQSRPGIDQVLKWCHGKWLVRQYDAVIEELVIDTRKIADPAEALFIALGSRRDGHKFIADAYTKGIRNFLVSEELDTSHFAGANFIIVKNTLDALQQLVAARRRQFDIPVVGITGSNGKTIVKEWLYQLLSESYKTVRSPKSYNSQIGVPLSVWLLEPRHELAIFEAGISQTGEMDRLEHIIQPSIGIFTNIGEAHSEGFMNTRQKINEKLLLFRNADKLVYCKDYPELNECMVQYHNQLKGRGDKQLTLFTWSQKTSADLQVKHIAKEGHRAVVDALYHDENISISIPFTDPASIENAIHCWCVLLLLGIGQEVIKKRMLSLQPVSMRLELRHGINDSTIINDSYNSDLTSLLIALDYLDQQKQHRQHTVILSDMLQIARGDAELYEEVAEHISRRSIQRFIGIGPALYKHRSAFRKNKKLKSAFFKSTDDFLKKFHLVNFDKEAVLLKGARVFTFEKIATLLEQKVHQTVLSINLSSVTHNLNVFRSRLKKGVKTMAMVKAFSYGSGSYEIASLLQFAGVDYLAVAYTDEGISLRKAGITMPIMVMSPDATTFDRMIAWQLEPEIFNLQSLRVFTAMAQTLQVQYYPIHIKLDTGMHRLGFMEADIELLAKELELNPYVKVASIFSHLAASEDTMQDEFTMQQSYSFDKMSNAIMEYLPHKPLLHLCNSSGIARHPALHYDMVRLGLGLYGIESSSALRKELKQVSTLKTTIAQVKTIPVGDSIGYNRRAIAQSEMRTATICIGYADGYPRSLGNGKAHVLIHGKPAAITGVVCMDMCMVDITDIPEAKEGDEVIVFSPDLPITKLAEWGGTIPYELMTGISQRVKRIYENEV